MEAQTSRALTRHANALSELCEIKTALKEIKGSEAIVEIGRQRELLRLAKVRIKSSQWELEKVDRNRLAGESVEMGHPLCIR
jgi:hypothetical protein